MDIFSLITLLGGLAFFLYGMTVMSAGLEKMTGGKLERALSKITSSPFRGLLLGMGITVAIQSSSALTVMLVGLVNSGVMQFSQTVHMLMGSNVGTTLTAWILSLSGIESSNIFLRLLKPSSFAPIFAFVGILLILSTKQEKKKSMGGVFIGFAVLMFGMSLMSGAMEPLSEVPEFASILTAFNNPLLGVLVGAVFTGIIQSSAASIGILQALSMTGSISYAMASPIIMGLNIGTCVTSLISGIGVNKNAKRVAIFHTLFNIIGTVIFLIIYYLLKIFIDTTFMNSAISPFGIAVIHSLFNVVTTFLLLPFSKQLIKLSETLIPGKSKKPEAVFIDERLLATPSFAIAECVNMTVSMGHVAAKSLSAALDQLGNYDEKEVEGITADEDTLDKYEDKLGTYLVRLSSRDLQDSDSQRIAELLHMIGDFERIGDHALNLCDSAEEMKNKNISFSKEANADLLVLKTALSDILAQTVEAFEKNDAGLASRIEPFEQRIDDLVLEAKTRHIARLQSGHCTIEHGFVLSDILNNIERSSDHCSNIAAAVIAVAQHSFDSHEYLNSIKTMDNEEFKDCYNEYKRKYKFAV